MVANAASLIKLSHPKYVSLIYSSTFPQGIQVYINILFRFEPADCFCNKLITVQRWILEPHNIWDGTICNNGKRLKPVKYYREVLHLNMTGFMDLSLTSNTYTNAKIRIYPVGIYLLKGNNENYRTRCEICSKLKKKTPERPHWIEDINKHWRRSCLSIVNFEKILHLFLVFILEFRNCCRLSLPAEIKVQTSKNYETCNYRCKLCHINQMDQTATRKD